MLVFACLAPDVTPLPNGAIQISGTAAIPGPSLHLVDRIAPAALKAAAATFMAGSPEISEMFKSGSAGAVDDIAVSADGTVYVTATIPGGNALLKVNAGVYRSLAVAIRVTARDATNPAVISGAEITGVSLVDRPGDDAFRLLMKAAPPVPDPVTLATQRVQVLSDLILDLSARLRRCEEAPRR